MEIGIDRVTLALIFNAIRRSFRRSDIYKKSLSKYLSKIKGPRGGLRYTCDICKKPFAKTSIEMDHYPDPVVPLNIRWYQMTVEQYYENVFHFPIRALCKKCHKSHTAKQRRRRK